MPAKRKRTIKAIPVTDIPEAMTEDLSAILQKYSVNLVGLRDESQFAHCGSGTLVMHANEPLVLTAAHCARALSQWDAIGLVLVDYRHRFVMPNLGPIFVDEPKTEELGPDLAFLKIPASDIGTLCAHKIFFNLGRGEHLGKDDPATEMGLWALVGAPAETSDLEDPSDLGFTQTAHWIGVDEYCRRGEHDYLELGVPEEEAELPANFRGTSGGGVWQVEIEMDKNGRWGAKLPVLMGCAFYETVPTRGRFTIRCHGPRSIYERGLRILRAK
ncbi:hypothetical protein ABI59_01050 [Acidobacteria bacterium Mor1]|nr:hypothetical protein ABI59_01050 [Acidobacteria bacterium Mor1]